ncbi:MAG TPA: hypothetical protein VGX16_00820, partial [Solirubrobacteraceae bacterium]|nr:hypothetical protein [Solirubrobacteraceae bacterium]
MSNGLGSPLCRVGGLSGEQERNCRTSGFVAAPAPTANYGLDVHIDTGLLGVTVTTVLEDVVITPVWDGLVWAVHGVIVALEWCFTIDLLGSSTMGDLGRGLREAEATFT